MEPQRNTIQRTLILEAVRELKNHATAEDIYQKIVPNHPTISRTTVYRNLNQLAEAGEIKKIEFAAGADRFDHITTNHYHIHCTKCNRVFDIDMDYLPNLEKSIKDLHSCTLDGHIIMFNGICPTCKKEL